MFTSGFVIEKVIPKALAWLGLMQREARMQDTAARTMAALVASETNRLGATPGAVLNLDVVANIALHSACALEGAMKAARSADALLLDIATEAICEVLYSSAPEAPRTKKGAVQ